MISTAVHSAHLGIQENLLRFAEAADRIANPDRQATASDIVDLKLAQNGVTVNTAVLRQANEMSRHLIDILA